VTEKDRDSREKTDIEKRQTASGNRADCGADA
jgi:hypothetical protein